MWFVHHLPELMRNEIASSGLLPLLPREVPALSSFELDQVPNFVRAQAQKVFVDGKACQVLCVCFARARIAFLLSLTSLNTGLPLK